MSKTNIYLVAIFITKLMKSSKTQVGIKRKRSRGVFQRCESAKRFKIRRQKPAAEESASSKINEENEDGISRNECICDDLAPKITAKEPDAHIVAVPEWRLQKVQSPIKLKHEDSNEYDHFEPLEFHGHWDNEGSATFTNNGYTATLRFVDRELPILKGGPLHEDSFIFEQLHFHWSEDDHSGCEHIFEDQEFCMEAHAVHYNTKYESFAEAADKHDGLAVVAFFLKATDDDENPCFKKLSDGVKNIVKIDSTTSVPADCLTWFWDAAHCKGYYTYQGSLTTEPYYESVSWILYPTPIHISRNQVQLFRSMKSTHCETQTIRKNVRPIQEQMPKGKLGLIYVRSHKQGAH